MSFEISSFIDNKEDIILSTSNLLPIWDFVEFGLYFFFAKKIQCNVLLKVIDDHDKVFFYKFSNI